MASPHSDDRPDAIGIEVSASAITVVGVQLGSDDLPRQLAAQKFELPLAPDSVVSAVQGAASPRDVSAMAIGVCFDGKAPGSVQHISAISQALASIGAEINALETTARSRARISRTDAPKSTETAVGAALAATAQHDADQPLDEPSRGQRDEQNARLASGAAPQLTTVLNRRIADLEQQLAIHASEDPANAYRYQLAGIREQHQRELQQALVNVADLQRRLRQQQLRKARSTDDIEAEQKLIESRVRALRDDHQREIGRVTDAAQTKITELRRELQLLRYSPTSRNSAQAASTDDADTESSETFESLLQAERDRSAAELEALAKTHARQLQTQRRGADQEATELRAEIAALGTRIDRASTSETDVTAIGQRAEAAEAEVRVLRAEIARADKQAEADRAQTAAAHAQQLEAERSRLATEAERLRLRATADADSMRADAERSMAELVGRADAAEASRASLKAQVAELTATTAELAALADELRATNSETAAASAAEHRAALESATQEAQEFQQRADSAEAALQEQTDELKRVFNSEAVIAKRELDSLATKLAETTTAAEAEAAELHDQIASLQADLRASGENAEETQSEVDELRPLKQQLSELDERSMQLEDDVRAKQRTIESLTAELTEAQATTARLEQAQVEGAETVADLRDELEVRAARVETAETSQSTTGRELRDAAEQIAVQRRRLDAQAAELATASERSSQLEVELTERSSQIDELTQWVQDLTTHSDLRDDEATNAEARLGQLQKRLAERTNELDETRRDNERLEDALAVAEARTIEADATEQRTSQLEGDLAKAERRIADLDAEKVRLETRQQSAAKRIE